MSINETLGFVVKGNKSKNLSDLFGKKADQEITQTYTWILSHLEEDSNVSLPKQEVYDEYRAFCEVHRFEPLCVADFGKAMKHTFPRVKPRRLGQRGNSRYCYSGLRKKYSLQPPSLPSLFETNNFNHLSNDIDSQQQNDQPIDNNNYTDDKHGDSTTVSHNPINSNRGEIYNRGVSQDHTFAMSHHHIIQDSPFNSTYSTPAEQIPLNTIHSQEQHSYISECQQTDENAINPGNLMNGQSPIYGHQEQDYSQTVHNNNDYSTISDRQMGATNSYVPPMENNSYQRFYYSQQGHQTLCSPFVSPSSTPNPFVENCDQHDSYNLPMFNY